MSVMVGPGSITHLHFFFFFCQNLWLDMLCILCITNRPLIFIFDLKLLYKNFQGFGETLIHGGVHTQGWGGLVNSTCVLSALVLSEFTSQELWHSTQISDHHQLPYLQSKIHCDTVLILDKQVT